MLSRTDSSAQETVFEFSDSLKVDVGLHLFPSEYVLVEVKLDLLIGDVDAKLLEGVLLEVLEAEDVQDADVQALVFLSGGERKKNVSLFKHIFCPVSIVSQEFILVSSQTGLILFKTTKINLEQSLCKDNLGFGGWSHLSSLEI